MTADIKVNLLLVDDKPENLIALEAVLDPLDCNIFKATSGFKALEILETTEVALILLDVHMPSMDGFETAKRIKQKFSDKNPPIVFISAVYKEDPYVHKGYEVGAVDYIPKPFDPAVLKEKVRIYTEGYKKSKILQIVEKQLAETASKFKRLLDSLPDVVCMTSADGILTFLNKAIESYSGFKQEDWVGKAFSSLMPAEDFTVFKKNFEMAMKDTHRHIFKTRILTKSNEYLPVEASVGPVMSDSTIDGAVCIVLHPSKKP